MNSRGSDRSVRARLVPGLLLAWTASALAAPPEPAVEKVRAVLISFDRDGRSMVYERAHKHSSARVSDEALPKLAAFRSGQVVELRLQAGADGYPIVLDAKKPGNKVEYLLFLVGALIVQLIPGG